MPALDYATYIQSRPWARRRRAALKAQGGRCARCGTRRRLHVHHLTYARLGHELPADLLVVCERCHDLIHATHRLMPDLELAEVTAQVVASEPVRGVRPAPAFTPRHLRDTETINGRRRVKEGWSRASWKP